MDAHKMSANEAEAPGAASNQVAAFLATAGGDRVAGLLAFGLATEAGEAAAPSAPAKHREEALRELEVWAFRRLHNQAAELRREGAAEAHAAMRAPPSFLTLVLAALTALAIAGGAAWLALAERQLGGG